MLSLLKMAKWFLRRIKIWELFLTDRQTDNELSEKST